MSCAFAALLILSALQPARAAEVRTFNERDQVFNNKDCAARGSCALKLFRLNTVNFHVTMRDGSHGYGTRMIACFETKDIKDLEQFGLAQFIRGCQYYSQSKNGLVSYDDYVVATQSGETGPYRYRDWIVDGFVNDPLDWGADPAKPRHYYYWNRVPGWEAGQKSGDVFGIAGPRGHLLCVRDLPGSAFAEKDSAKNVSLELRTCLYKTIDVPREVALDALQSIKPVHCFDWSNSFVFDHARNEYQSPAGIAPYCLK